MCKEWTKPFKKTNPLYLGSYREVIENCNKDKFGISEIVGIDGYWPISYSFTYKPTGETTELSDSRHIKGEILKNEFN